MSKNNKNSRGGLSEGKMTTSEEEIKNWVAQRDGYPAVVKGTNKSGDGLLRIDFGKSNEPLERISWEEFFQIFESKNLAFLYQEETADGSMSRFFKFVERSDQSEDEDDDF